MATTRLILTPEAAHFPVSNFAPLTSVSATYNRPCLSFDADTDKAAYWSFIAPQGLAGALSAKIHYCMASATTGNLYWQTAVEAVTPGDATDLDAGTSFDTANSGNGTVPATAGYEQVISVTLTNADSVAAGDLVRVSINRDADNGSDSAAGAALLLAVEIQEA